MKMGVNKEPVKPVGSNEEFRKKFLGK